MTPLRALEPRPGPRNGLYLDASFKQRSQRKRPRPRRPYSFKDHFLLMLVGLGMAASLLLAVAMLLGAAWLVVAIAREIAQLVR